MRFAHGNIISCCRWIITWILLFLYSASVYSQQYGNEWIQYDQRYFRFAVAADGVHRLGYSVLDNALQNTGIQLENIPPQYFQVWNRGRQLYLFVSLGSDGVFNQEDFIEFFAEKNDGWFDQGLYPSSQDQINPYYSLFTDTAYCFFSWNATGNNARMTVENNTAFLSYTPLSYVWATQRNNYPETYLSGERFATSSYDVTLGDAAYTGGEGYSGSKIWVNQNQVRNIPVNGLYSQGPAARLEYRVVAGSNRALTTPQHHCNVDLGSIHLTDSSWEYNIPVHFTRQVPLSSLSGGNASVIFYNIEVPGQSYQEWTSVSSVSITYPRNLNYANSASGRFSIPEVTGPAFSYVRISGINLQAGDSLRMFDLLNHRRIRVVSEGGFQKALVSNLPGMEDCFFVPESQIVQVQKVEAVDAATASFFPLTDPQIIQDVDYLIITGSDLVNEAQLYATYRAQNGYPVLYHPLVVDVEQLYMQFGYGIKKSPLAIRNFLRFVLDQYPATPRQVFLIGKSFQAIDYRSNAYYWKSTLVPTYGTPPSDWMFTLGLQQVDQVAIPVGRLSASTKQDVLNYLEKVESFESNQKIPKPALKNILQFGGGSSFGEQELFKYYLSQYDDTLSKPFLGAEVFNFFKTSLDPIMVDQSAYIHDLLENKGVSIINYFGHASGISFDMSLGDPGDFNNLDKYYFVVANSCWAGDIFNYHGGLSSERYVLLPKKGAIAYLASVSEGEPYFLHVFTSGLFHHLAGDCYNQSLGSILQQNILNILQDSSYSSFSFREVCLEMALHGDPALVVSATPYPDYDMTPGNGISSKIQFSPREITAELDSFRLMIIHTNSGKALDTLYFIRIQREVEGNILIDTLIRVKAPLNRDTVYFSMALDRKNGSGLNTFRVTLDAYNELDENGRKFNNSWETGLFIRSADIIPVYPPEFAIVPDKDLTVYASTFYPFQSPENYTFQLDTTSYFNSPLRKETLLEHAGGVIGWDVQLPLNQDSIVYFWRCGLSHSIPDSVQWRNSSFQYIPGRRGWSQAHFLQMEENDYKYVSYLKDSLRFAFVQDIKTVTASTYIINHPWQEENFKVNNDIIDIWSCTHNRCAVSTGIKFAVFNPVSFEPWFSYDMGNGIGPYGNKHCKSYPVASFDFCNYYPAERQLMAAFIDTVPEGYYVLAMSHMNHRAQQYEEDVYQAFEAIGSQFIRFIQDTSSYIIFGIKGGQVGSAFEAGFESARDSLVKLTVNVETRWNSGSITSPMIGPASKWQSLHWRVKQDDRDSVHLVVLGVRHNGITDTLIKTISVDSADIEQLDQSISAELYPYLRLVLVMEDTSTLAANPRDPAILQRWQVIYEGIPETAIDPAAAYYFYKDTLQEGDTVRLTIAFHNISDQPMDSLLVVYWINRGGSTDTLFQKRLRPHPAGDILTDSISFGTTGIPGWNALWMEVNPYFDQAEQTHVNNIGEIPFFVVQDEINPILDVTFDNIHILDYDYVSPETCIKIKLWDENNYLRLADTSLIRIWIAYENEDRRPVYFHQQAIPQLQFQPGTGSPNRCTVLYYPSLEKDGVYTLFVNASDLSGNIAGYNDYCIHFRVLNQGLRSEVLAWPNPFHTYTRFVFLLTGNCVPEDFIIRIYDIAGRPVKEITSSAFGHLHIGTNIAASVWDGRDQNGTPLPAGVYLYKASMKFPCDEPVFSNSLKSNYYNFSGTSYGKVVIMR